MYKIIGKRIVDFLCSFIGLIILFPVFLVIAVLVRIKLGSPIIFKQPRPGYREKLFYLYKFRTMTDERDTQGKLLPDDKRLTKFGKALRATSLDELPELLNIMKGEMSVVGPRPLLVKDMMFMTQEQRRRHTVRPGLTGLAQINGRNAISWEQKLALDLEYIDAQSFFIDIKLLFKTIVKVIKREGISEEGMETAQDLGDFLLRNNKVDISIYSECNKKAEKIIKEEMQH
jgi:lipopolysaccharide/colanic/teichoic acid biosynthesis glycosyltransferase